MGGLASLRSYPFKVGIFSSFIWLATVLFIKIIVSAHFSKFILSSGVVMCFMIIVIRCCSLRALLFGIYYLLTLLFIFYEK